MLMRGCAFWYEQLQYPWCLISLLLITQYNLDKIILGYFILALKKNLTIEVFRQSLQDKSKNVCSGMRLYLQNILIVIKIRILEKPRKIFFSELYFQGQGKKKNLKNLINIVHFKKTLFKKADIQKVKQLASSSEYSAHLE